MLNIFSGFKFPANISSPLYNVHMKKVTDNLTNEIHSNDSSDYYPHLYTSVQRFGRYAIRPSFVCQKDKQKICYYLLAKSLIFEVCPTIVPLSNGCLSKRLQRLNDRSPD